MIQMMDLLSDIIDNNNNLAFSLCFIASLFVSLVLHAQPVIQLICVTFHLAQTVH